MREWDGWVDDLWSLNCWNWIKLLVLYRDIRNFSKKNLPTAANIKIDRIRTSEFKISISSLPSYQLLQVLLWLLANGFLLCTWKAPIETCLLYNASKDVDYFQSHSVSQQEKLSKSHVEEIFTDFIYFCEWSYFDFCKSTTQTWKRSGLRNSLESNEFGDSWKWLPARNMAMDGAAAVES